MLQLINIDTTHTIPIKASHWGWLKLKYRSQVLILLGSLVCSAVAYAGSACTDALAAARFLNAVQPTLFRAPYLNAGLRKSGVTVTKNTSSVQVLSDWLQVFEQDFAHAQKNEAFREKLRAHFYSRFIIKTHQIPESYFQKQIQRLREQGYGNVTLTHQMRGEASEQLIREQKESLDSWFDYLVADTPEMHAVSNWIKFWVFQSVTQMTGYNPENQTFSKRSKIQVGIFPELNREALALVLQDVKQNHTDLKDKRSFSSRYAEEITRLKAQAEAQAAALGTVNGEWRRYSQGSDETPLVESLKGQNTGWCTASADTAKGQLKLGDFHVYYSADANGNFTIPRIGMRFEGSRLVEVRGVGSHQHLDSIIAQTDILDQKLKSFGDKGKDYVKKSSDMKRLTELERKLKDNPTLSLSREELRFLYEIDSKIEGFGYQKDPRIEEIQNARDKRADLAIVFSCKPEQISFTKEEALSGNIVYHDGDLDLSSLTYTEGLTLPAHVGGYLNLRSLTSAEGLTLPAHVGRYLDLRSLTSAEGLTLPAHVGGNLYLGNLTSTEGLTLPTHVGGYLYLDKLTSAKGLILPTHIGGNLYLNRLTSAEGITLPAYIGGDFYLFSLTSAAGLTLPAYVGGHLYLMSLTSVAGLTLPAYVGKNLYLNNLTSVEGIIIPENFTAERILISRKFDLKSVKNHPVLKNKAIRWEVLE